MESIGSGLTFDTLDTLTQVIRYEFTYDSQGLLTAVTDGDGNQTVIERATSGDATAIVAPDGQRTALTLDASGNLTSDQPGRKPRTFTYNSVNRLSQVNVARKVIGSYTYNAQGQRTHKALPHGQHVIYHYDLNGNLLSETNALELYVTAGI